MSDVLEIKGFDELLKALKESPKKVMPYLKKAMTLSVRLVQERVAEYPPATEANQPRRISMQTHKPMGYYERGRGWWYPLVTERTLGGKMEKAQGQIQGHYQKVHQRQRLQAGGGRRVRNAWAQLGRGDNAECRRRNAERNYWDCRQ